MDGFVLVELIAAILADEIFDLVELPALVDDIVPAVPTAGDSNAAAFGQALLYEPLLMR